MKNRYVIIIGLTLLILLPFGINLAGWNAYAYIRVRNMDLTTGAFCGQCYLHWGEYYPDSWNGEAQTKIEEDCKADGLEYVRKNIINSDPFYLFLESRLDPLRPFSFSFTRYKTINSISAHFPQLLFLIAPISFWGWTLIKRKQNQRVDLTR